MPDPGSGSPHSISLCTRVVKQNVLSSLGS